MDRHQSPTEPRIVLTSGGFAIFVRAEPMAMLDLSISQELEMLEDRWSHVGPKYLFQRRMRLDEGFGGPEKPR